MLVELAIGDAYGAGFEYAHRSMVLQQNDLSGYVAHPRHDIRPGCYTDDTQMSIALAELIVSGAPWTPANIAAHFVAAFKRDPREGYARSFYAFLQEIQDADEFMARIRPTSNKSGSAMRAAPLGVLANPETVIAYGKTQAAVTHHTRDGIRAAVAASLMAHYFVYDIGPKAALPAFVNDLVPGPWQTPWAGKVQSKGMMSVRAALTAIVAHDSLRAILQACIAYTGDVDTVAAIALGAASCSHEIAQDLPRVLYETLENDGYGLDYLRRLDAQLMATVGVR